MKAVKKIILFLTGFCVYVTIECMFRGFSFAIMGCTGGIAILLLDKINDQISWNLDLSVQALIGSLLITSMELVIGLISKAGYLPLMWDYTNVPLNFCGVICLPFSIAWMFLSVVGIFMADAINYYIFAEPDFAPYYIIFRKFKITFPQRI